jgi:hypothetical protein
VRHAALGQPAEQQESVRGAPCGCGGAAVKEQSLKSPRLATRLRSAWESQ